MSSDLDEMLSQGPTLTFEPFTQPEAPEVPTVAEATQKIPEAVLTPAEQKMVDSRSGSSSSRPSPTKT